MYISGISGQTAIPSYKNIQSPSGAPTQTQTPTGDVVNLSTNSGITKDSFDNEDDYAAYKGVMDAAHTNPNSIVEAHSGLDQDRVYRLLGLID